MWRQCSEVGGVIIHERYCTGNFNITNFYNIQIYSKGALTEEQKKQLLLLEDAVTTMKPIYDGLQLAVKPLEANYATSYGYMIVKLGGKDTKVQVCFYIIYCVIAKLLQFIEVSWGLSNKKDNLFKALSFRWNQYTIT